MDFPVVKCLLLSLLFESSLPLRIDHIVNVSMFAGETATLKCVARGDPLLDINWLKFGTETVLSPNPTDSFRIEKEINDMVTPNLARISLVFSALKPSDAGYYTCSATNTAGTVKKTGQVIVEFEPHFINTPYTKTYGWANHNTSIECLVDAVPTAVVSWTHNGDQLKTGFTNMTFTVSYERGVQQIKSILKVAVNVANEEYIYGDYSCTAYNLHGSNSQIISLVKAEVPGKPLIVIHELNPTAVTLRIIPPTNNGGQKILDYKIVYYAEGSTDQKVKIFYISLDPIEPEVKAKLDGLEADTYYFITVEARNNVGYGTASQLLKRTPTLRIPEKVVFKSDPYGKVPDRYTVVWDTPLTGGSPLIRYTIKYVKVEVDGSDSESWTVKAIFDMKKEILVDNGKITSYELKELEPRSFYQVTVVAINAIGSSLPASFIFETRPRDLRSTPRVLNHLHPFCQN